MIFAFISLILLVYFYWINRKLFQSNEQFRTELVLPFFGNSYIFLCKDEEILKKIGYSIKRGTENYYKPKILWFGQKKVLFFTDPKNIEKILSSQKFAHKGFFYDFLKLHAGEGLITGSGPNYKKHRATISPFFDVNFNKNCYEIFEKCLNSCMEDMKEYCTGNTFNICGGALKECFMRFIGSVILGIDYDSKKDHQFSEDSDNMYAFAFSRLTRPWLHLDFIYKMTSVHKAEELIISRTTAFIQKTIENSRQRINSEVRENQINPPIVDQLFRILQENPDLMDKKVFRNHLYTLFLASEDTIVITAAFCCMMLGMYPEYQKKLARELRDYFGTIPSNARLEDIGHLPYLDMCIKETLRIQAIAPVITRKTVEECKIDSWTIPKDTEICIPIFYIHRDPKFWENPDHFHPDHFLPDNIRNRPIHAYLPFSAGPRGCIGRLLANSYLRIFLATFLQKFEIEADGKLPDIQFKMDISSRPIQGYYVRIKERIWN